jgi:hypothetical protein
MRRKLGWILIASLGALAVYVYHDHATELASLRRDLAGVQARDHASRAASGTWTPARYLPPGPPGRDDPSPARPARPARSEAPPSGDGDPRPAAADRPTALSWDEEARANQATVERAFATDVADSSWAVGAARDLREHLGATAAQLSSSLRNVDCRSSLCRVEVVTRDQGSAKKLMDKAFGVGAPPVWNGPMMAEYPPANPDGTASVVLYLGRDGTSLLDPVL